MRLDELGEKYQIQEATARVIEVDGIQELYPPQAEAVRKGLLDFKNLVVSIPTASGKSLLAELAAMNHVLKKKSKAIYLSPLKALAAEKYEDFTEKYGKIARIALSIGDYDSEDLWLRDYDVVICTYEKLDSLLRHNAPWVREVSLLVVDEIHVLDSADRGPTLEVVITKLRQMKKEMQILALSATIANSNDLAGWLDAELIEDDFRPTKLSEGILFDGQVTYNKKESYQPKGKSNAEVLLLAEDSLAAKTQALVFVNSRSSAEAVADRIAHLAEEHTTEGEKKELKAISGKILKALDSPTRQCRRLAKCVEAGVAFHHAGLPAEQRALVEKAFKGNLIKMLSATPTLAAGVNVPAKRVIVRDVKRFSGGGSEYIPVIEYKQFVGRAGRPKYDKEGESVLIAKTLREYEMLWSHYIEGSVEDIYSKLGIEPVLRMHTLGLIAQDFMREKEILGFFAQTFYGHQYKSMERLGEILDGVIAKLELWGFAEKVKDIVKATRLGKRVSEMYIDPLTAHEFIESFGKKKDHFTYLVQLSLASEMRPLSPVGKREEDEVFAAVKKHDEWLEMPEDAYELNGYMSAVKNAMVLEAWIEEKTEDEILEANSTAPGILKRKTDTADWLLYAMEELAKMTGKKKEHAEAKELRARVKYGVKEELLPLVRFKGIGRVRARKLMDAGLKGTKEIRAAEPGRLALLIGASAAKKLKEQIGHGQASAE